MVAGLVKANWDVNGKKGVTYYRPTERPIGTGGETAKVIDLAPFEWQRRNEAGAEIGPRIAFGSDPGYYRPKPVTKTQIVLHTTKGVVGSIGTLTSPVRTVSCAFVLDRDGTTYQLFDPACWSGHLGVNGRAQKQSIAIEIINAGCLLKQGDALHERRARKADKGKASFGNQYCKLTEHGKYYDLAQSEEGRPSHFTDPNWREYQFFARYTDAQYEQLVKLLRALSDVYGVKYEFLPNPDRYKKFATADIAPFEGITSHINYADGEVTLPDGTKAAKKVDIGPAFDWERLQKRGLFFPVNLAGKDEPAGSAVAKDAVDAFYTHTEQDHRGGYFPLGTNTVWHGGLHLHVAKGTPVVAVEAGEIVAARLAADERRSSGAFGSRNFILLRHKLSRERIDQLVDLYIPTGFAVETPGVALPTSAGDEPLELLPGDRLVRVDDESERNNEPGEAYPVRVASLTPGIVTLERYVVRGDDCALHREPKKDEAFHDLALIPGDKLRVLEERHKGGRKRFWSKVAVESLAEGLAEVEGYTVQAPTNVLCEAPDPAAAEVLPLWVGDKLQRTAAAPREGADAKPWVEVFATELAEGHETIGYRVEAAGHRLRDAAAKKPGQGKVVLDLVEGDELTLVEDGGGVARVSIKTLAEADVVGHYDVKRRRKLFKAKSTARALGTVQPGDRVQVVERPGSAWARVLVERSGQVGWIQPGRSAFTPAMVKRADAQWVQAVQEGFVAVARGITPLEDDQDRRDKYRSHVDDKSPGWVPMRHAKLEATGKSRVRERADLVAGSDAPTPEQIRYVRFDSKQLAREGRQRKDEYAALFEETSNVEYDAAKMSTLHGIAQRDYARLANEEFYSLYMHLDRDHEAVKDLPWLQTTTALKVRGDTFLHSSPDGSALVDLRPGDELEVTGAVRGTWHEVKVGALADNVVGHYELTKSMPFRAAGRVLQLHKGDRVQVVDPTPPPGRRIRVRLAALGPTRTAKRRARLNRLLGTEGTIRHAKAKLTPVFDGAARSSVVADGTTAWVNRTDGLFEAVLGPDEALLDRLAKGEVTKIEGKSVKAGESIWNSGDYGSKGVRAEMMHIEVFSAQNLLHMDTWHEAQDPVGSRGDYTMDSEAILAAIGDGDIDPKKLTADDVAELYRSPRGANLRTYACRFVNEWAVDLDRAIPSLGLFNRLGAARRIRPYLWWDAARRVGVDLPSTPFVWHYNPVAFAAALTQLDLDPDAYTHLKPTPSVGDGGDDDVEPDDDDYVEPALGGSHLVFDGRVLSWRDGDDVVASWPARSADGSVDPSDFWLGGAAIPPGRWHVRQRALAGSGSPKVTLAPAHGVEDYGRTELAIAGEDDDVAAGSLRLSAVEDFAELFAAHGEDVLLYVAY